MNEELVGVFAGFTIADAGVVVILYNKDYNYEDEKNSEILMEKFKKFIDKPVRLTISEFDGDAKRLMEVD